MIYDSVISMKPKTNKLIILTFLFFLILFSFDYLFTTRHEQAHKVICEEFGGEGNYSINFSFSTLSFFGQLNSCEPILENEIESYKIAQANVEAIGYQLYVGLILFILLFFIHQILRITEK